MPSFPFCYKVRSVHVSQGITSSQVVLFKKYKFLYSVIFSYLSGAVRTLPGCHCPMRIHAQPRTRLRPERERTLIGRQVPTFGYWRERFCSLFPQAESHSMSGAEVCPAPPSRNPVMCPEYLWGSDSDVIPLHEYGVTHP